MLDAALRAIGVDSLQWRALVLTGLRVDLRTTGAMSLSRRGSTSGAHALRGFVLSLLAMGAFITIVLFVVADIFFALCIFFSFVIFSIASSLLIDFHSIVLSPDDQRQLGYQPIDSRTFFAARVTSVLLYVAMMTVSLGIFPVIGCLFKPPGNGSDGGIVVALAVIAALIVAALLTTFVAIGMYVALLHYVPTARLKSALTYVQLAATFLVYSSYFFLPRLIGSRALREQILPRNGWILANPGTWFASYVDVALGRATMTQIALASLTLVLCAVSMRLVGGRLSLDYADRLSLLMTETAAEADAASASAPLPHGRLFRDGERRAIALLVRGLFRHDMKFRLGVLSVLPLTLVYLFGGVGPQGVTDPFVSPGEGGQLIYFAVLFFPSMLRQALSRSDAFRAAWILYATPADSARLVLAIKDLVLVRFVLPYLLFVAVLIVYWFERIDHLAVLMLTLALLVHLIVMVQLWISPELPFSQPSAKGARTRDTIILIVIVSSLAPQLPWLLHVVFATPWRLVATLAALVLVNVALLQVTTRRVRRLAIAAEFPM